jgi:hypothetical protein
VKAAAPSGGEVVRGAGAGRAAVYLRLGRVSNLPTVWSNVLAGAALGGAAPGGAAVLALAAALSLFYLGGMFMNDAFDREADARERPERPIPSGAIGAGEVFALSAVLLGAGWLAVVAVAAPRRAASLTALALAAAIVLYDAWHKGNPLGPLLMGICRALVYVTAALATSAAVGEPLVRGVLVLLAYVLGLASVAKHEGRGAFALWPLAFLAVPVVHGLPLIAADGPGGILLLALAAALLLALGLVRGGRPGAARQAVAVLIAGIALVDAVLVAGAGRPGAALLASLGFPLTLALQRWVRGT